MALPRQIRKQVQDANELLAQLNAKPGEQPAAGGDTPPADQPPQNPNEPNNKKPDQQPAAAPADGGSNPPPAPQGPPAESFEQKYSTLQGKYNSEIAAKDRTIAGLTERVNVLEQLIVTLRQNPAPAPTPTPAPTAPAADDKRPGKTYVKPEDVEEYGNDMVEFAKRAAREAVEPELQRLREENAQLKTQVGDTRQQLAGTARERLLATLAREVTNWETINVDAKFLAWLEQPDVFSGLQRREALVNAYNANDAARVVGIFKAFIREDSATDQPPTPAPRTAAVDLGTLVAPGTPRGPGAEAPGDNKKIWSSNEISGFYDQKRRGKISAQDAIAIERDIAAATREGRVKL